MPTITWLKIWNAHPYPNSPCDTVAFPNQCAIRMSVALTGAGINLSSFHGAKCYPNMGHDRRHILRAQELADWIALRPTTFGTVGKRKNVTASDYASKPGIVFIQNGWGPTDHIDIWNGVLMKGGSPEYFALGKEVWFWPLS
ncbi:type VI secretion system amidase effector protein Tae4 [Sphingomonas sp. HF-S3]|uniref:Type VI secretion system amidase effector protein Tae4 n=1 Tax=Sphingomonas rustica TaxID=3103142 RepID=A0ABV0BEG1_9SPHN